MKNNETKSITLEKAYQIENAYLFKHKKERKDLGFLPRPYFNLAIAVKNPKYEASYSKCAESVEEHNGFIRMNLIDKGFYEENKDLLNSPNSSPRQPEAGQTNKVRSNTI